MTDISVMTARTLTRLSVGAPINFAGSDLFVLSSPVASGGTVSAIYSRDDDDADRLISIVGPGRGYALPEALLAHRQPAFGRILSFVDRSTIYPLTLPRGWGQYKQDNLVTFFALPVALGSPMRWIAEVNVLGTLDVVFWSLIESRYEQELKDFRPQHALYVAARNFWREQREQGLQALSGPAESVPGVDVILDAAPQAAGVAKARAYTQWLPDLTPKQREFVEAPVDRSIRLRGPAGSGKTLALGIKAIREVLEARRNGRPIRTLFVTHSWALAGEVDQLLTALSDEGRLTEINTLPLVAVAQELLPDGMLPNDLRLIGDDSLTDKMTQLAQIQEIIEEFRTGDWITFRRGASGDFIERLESLDTSVRRGLAWDLLVEFGCVLGADGIFPAVNSEQRYLRLHRAPWMMRLDSAGDRRPVYAMYEMYYEALRARSLLTSDQLLNDFLNYLESFTWNHRRLAEGYDLVFVDEFHLFNTLERQVLRYLSRDVNSYPKLFMALDPRQSPWDVFFGDADATTSEVASPDDDLDTVQTVDIPTVHRSSPQILDLVKHIHLDYANLSLDDDWSYSISEVESLATPGPIPSLFVSDTFAEEKTAIYNAIAQVYPKSHTGAQVALAIVDEDRYVRYREVFADMAKSGRYRIIQVTSRDDVSSLKYHKRGIVVGPAEYLAGLQFDTVLIAGLPNMSSKAPNMGVRRRGALSLLYLAISRASREVRIFLNDDFGGLPDVLARARDEGVLGVFRT